MIPNIKYGVRLLFFLGCTLCLQSCIKDNENLCEEEEAILVVNVIDLITGLDITDTEDVGEVSLFIFDPAGHYVNLITVPYEDLRARKPITITHTDTRGLWVSAWGNLKEGQIVPLLTKETSLLTNETITLITDEEGFNGCPDDLFFGVKQINIDPATRSVVIIEEQLPISMKNARMHLTVRGLPHDALEADYYFTIEGHYNGYNFKGEPMPGTCKIKQAGIFHENRDYAVEEAFNLVHSVSEEQCMTVTLYKIEPVTRAVTAIATITQDDTGKPIAPLAGETTNVLIDLTGATASVRIEVTPWNEIYHWMSW